MLTAKVEIKQIKDLDYYKRCQLFSDALDIVRKVNSDGYKARHMIEKAMSAQGIYFRVGEKRLYISRDHTAIDLYVPWKGISTVSDITEAFESEVSRFTFEEFRDFEPSLYKARQEIETYFSGEMTAKEFLARKKAYAVELRSLADEVEKLKANATP